MRITRARLVICKVLRRFRCWAGAGFRTIGGPYVYEIINLFSQGMKAHRSWGQDPFLNGQDSFPKKMSEDMSGSRTGFKRRSSHSHRWDVSHVARYGERVYASSWDGSVRRGISGSARVRQSFCWSQFVDGGEHAVWDAVK